MNDWALFRHFIHGGRDNLRIFHQLIQLNVLIGLMLHLLRLPGNGPNATVLGMAFAYVPAAHANQPRGLSHLFFIYLGKAPNNSLSGGI